MPRPLRARHTHEQVIPDDHWLAVAWSQTMLDDTVMPHEFRDVVVTYAMMLQVDSIERQREQYAREWRQ